MFKLAAVLLVTFMVAVSYGAIGGIPGGFTDRPELIEDKTVKALVSYAAEHLAVTQNLILDNIKVIRVQTQVVAGINYKLDFIGQPINGLFGLSKSCQALIYVRFDSTKSITSVTC